VLWDSYRRDYGTDGSPGILVARGSSRDFNPLLPQLEIDRELERDPVRSRLVSATIASSSRGPASSISVLLTQRRALMVATATALRSVTRMAIKLSSTVCAKSLRPLARRRR
jgi:hypothetical protein